MRRSTAMLVAALFLALAPRASPVAGSTSADGKANRLLGESSPYLRLHAYNPVDWYPWGPEALERARRESKPIFLSVGYSTCYWCHVMEREVFSNPEIAALMNQWFINIKVDREERPELDELYMTATQMATGRGGWPNSVFLTPDLEPFFAGTYFPPRDRGGRPGFPTVLESLHNAWETRRDEVESQAARLTAAIQRALGGPLESTATNPGLGDAEKVVAALANSFDGEWGGFGGGPKFPSPSNLFLLWDRAREGDAKARQMVVETLRKMGQGAIYDQLDGGFHRYTLDRAWRIPHFEKMLYDNALLAELLATVGAETSDPEMVRLAKGTLDFVLRELTLPNGAFKSAIDAETNSVEGAFYIWTREELEELLGKEGMSLLGPIFGFDGPPNFEDDHYTVYLTASLEEHAARIEITRLELLESLAPHVEKLRAKRAQREFPLVDDKVLTDWNALMISALARAGSLLGERRYVEASERAARFVLTMVESGGDETQLHTWRDGEAKIEAFVDDYAFLIRALLTLNEVTGAESWLGEARRLSAEMDSRLAAPGGGYYASGDHQDLLVRIQTANDGAIPSGNGIAVLNHLALARRTGEAEYRGRAAAALRTFVRELSGGARSAATLAAALFRYRAAETAAAQDVLRERPLSPLAALAHSLVEVSAGWIGEGRASGRPLTVELEIKNGWHVNANPASLDFLVPSRLEGASRIVYPPGETFRFEFSEQPLSVWSGRVSIRGEVEAGATPRLTYQACDDTRCLPPVTRRVPLPE